MLSVIVTDSEKDQTSEVAVGEDTPLMYALRDAGLPIEGTCGGYASCGTCHVYVAPDWIDRLDPLEEVELEMLELLDTYKPDRSRLSCQIVMKPEWDGLVVELAPEC
ncbi:2Fe-2S ferredoxin [Rhodoligotrophos appendicifer]|uniref:2Fe-2S iron-sulfur cluster-binding protein n=1 Tax=Rhodoligotrophos appendicifer TaxID=987056 RepID=UPI001186719B|nr:2Fe-2S iron-sulfur cluster-binding protein [Rhodoligotrophos appendicifer]